MCVACIAPFLRQTTTTIISRHVYFLQTDALVKQWAASQQGGNEVRWRPGQ